MIFATSCSSIVKAFLVASVFSGRADMPVQSFGDKCNKHLIAKQRALGLALVPARSGRKYTSGLAEGVSVTRDKTVSTGSCANTVKIANNMAKSGYFSTAILAGDPSVYYLHLSTFEAGDESTMRLKS